MIFSQTIFWGGNGYVLAGEERIRNADSSIRIVSSDDEQVKDELADLFSSTEKEEEPLIVQESGTEKENVENIEISKDTNSESSEGKKEEIEKDEEKKEDSVKTEPVFMPLDRIHEENKKKSKSTSESLLDMVGPSGQKLLGSELPEKTETIQSNGSEKIDYLQMIGPAGRKIGQVASPTRKSQETSRKVRESLVGVVGPSGKPILVASPKPKKNKIPSWKSNHNSAGVGSGDQGDNEDEDHDMLGEDDEHVWAGSTEWQLSGNVNYVSLDGEYVSSTQNSAGNSFSLGIDLVFLDNIYGGSIVGARTNGTTILRESNTPVTLSDLEIVNYIQDEGEFPGPVIRAFEVGPSDDHLIFSSPMRLDIPVGSEFDLAMFTVHVKHYGDTQFTTDSLTTNPNATCLQDGRVLPSQQSNGAVARNGMITLYTCSASSFVVSYEGDNTYSNFVDNEEFTKSITVSTGDVGVGTTIQDLQVEVIFHSIDGEDPFNPGAGNASSNQVSMSLTHPDETTTIQLFGQGTYSNGPTSGAVTVTFDDAAVSAPSGIPATGTFLPADPLSTFDGLSPIGDWVFEVSDVGPNDGVILYQMKLIFTDDAVCGDGVAEGAEGCDDGNTTGGDGCSDICLVENSYACNLTGSGVQGGGSCESGVCDLSETTPTCETANSCGNNLKEDGEQCDDGNAISGDGCDSSCFGEFCGNGSIDPVATGTIIFLEDFEFIGNGILLLTGEVYSTTGYRIIFDRSASRGRLTYGDLTVHANGGQGSLSLDVFSNGPAETQYAIFELDLSVVTGSADVEFGFDFAHHGDESSANDMVRIRGSASDAWVLAYDWASNKTTEGIFKSIEGIDIDQILANAGQSVSETFQIRFGQQDDFPIITTEASDGLTLDNLLIIGTPFGPLQEETCDDGNESSGDGCSATCEVEVGYVCTGEPSICNFTSNVLINEVAYNPPGMESRTEWFELYNPTAITISLSGWTITEKVDPSSSKSYTFGSSVSIASGDYLLVVNDGTNFSLNYPSYASNIDIDLPGMAYFELKNSADDYLSLKNPNNEVVDYVAWEQSSNWTISVSDGSICRLDTPDTDTVADWTTSCVGTPGAYNFPGNTPPSDISLSTTGVDENNTLGEFVAVLSGVDSDPGESLTFSLVSGTGDSDNASFSISGTGLYIQEVTDFESKSTYSIRLQVSDGRGGLYSEAFTINVANLAEIYGFASFALDGDEVQIGENASEFNSNNMYATEEMRLEFTVDCPAGFSGDIELEFTAGGTSACSLGNLQSEDCYSYASGARVTYASGQTTSTFKDLGDFGDRIGCTYVSTGGGGMRDYTCLIDEHYNPNVFKRYSADYDFTDLKFQDAADQKITRDNQIRVMIKDDVVPLNADWYRLDFRVQAVGNPARDLEAYVCNSTYMTGDPEATTNCELVGQRARDELSGLDSTKFRAVFTHEVIDTLGDIKYVVLKTDENNVNKYYALKTFKAQTSGRTTNRDYSTDNGTTWTNLGDGYETELNFNWLVSGFDPTRTYFRVNACDIQSDEFVTAWNVEPTIDYPPLVDLISLEDGTTVSGTIDVNRHVQEINAEDYTVNVYASGAGGVVYLATGQSSGIVTYSRDTTLLSDGQWDIFVEACEVAGFDTILCGSDDHIVTISNAGLGTGGVSIEAPSVLSYSTGLMSESYVQVVSQLFSDYFVVSDVIGADSGFYTTVELSDLSGQNYGELIPASSIERYATGVDLLSGTTNPRVEIGTGWDSYRPATGVFTFLKRDPSDNSAVIGSYGAQLGVNLSIPAYTRPDQYRGIITYTLYEN